MKSESSTVALDGDLSGSIHSPADVRREAELLGKVPLIPLNYSFGIVTAQPDQAVSLKRAVRTQARVDEADVVVIYAVRQPG